MLTWLADVLKGAGLPVVELSGWQTRGKQHIVPLGLVAHHTATGPHVRDEVVDKLLAAGRPDLAGPLSQLGLRRDGTWVVIAAGRANHNGYGLWGNDSIGVEAYNDGTGEPWPPAQMKSYQAGVAAICRRMRWGTERVKGHKETDPRRKIDPTFNMTIFRAGVAGAMAGTPPPQEDDEMKLYLVKEQGTDPLFVTDLLWRWPVTTQAHLDVLRFLNAVQTPDGGTWFEWTKAQVNAIPLAPTSVPASVLSAIRTAAESAATPDDVLGIIQSALVPVVEGIEGIDTGAGPGDAATVWQIIRDLAEANL